MDIHKPKPWRGLREFLKEYVIIVVGVLTALAGEQAVEWLHWRHVAKESEVHLAAGLKDDLVNAAEWLMIEPCMRTRLGGLAAELAKPGPAWPANQQSFPPGYRQPSLIPKVVTSPGRLWPHAGWDTALASGVLNHLARDRVDGYAEIYHLVDFVRDRQSEVQLMQSRLAPLAYDRILDEADRTRLISDVAEVEHAENGMINSAGMILRDAHALGIEPDTKALEQRQSDEQRARGGCVTAVKLPLPALPR